MNGYQTVNAREKIDRQRSLIAMVSLFIVLFIIGLLCWAMKNENPAVMPLIIVTLLVLVVTLGMIQRCDTCPECGKNISTLPNGGFLSWPRLSPEVKCCPFCGHDYSSKAAQKDNGPLS